MRPSGTLPYGGSVLASVQCQCLYVTLPESRDINTLRLELWQTPHRARSSRYRVVGSIQSNDVFNNSVVVAVSKEELCAAIGYAFRIVKEARTFTRLPSPDNAQNFIGDRVDLQYPMRLLVCNIDNSISIEVQISWADKAKLRPL